MDTMTRSAPAPEVTAVLHRAALRAIRAPSIHNTQPWTFALSDDRLDIHAERKRGLHALDPHGRQLMISCGCALLNARVAIAAAGYEPIIERFPRRRAPDFVARLRVGAEQPRGRSVALDSAIDRRRSNRRRFMDEPVPDSLVTRLASVARLENAVLLRINAPEHRELVARLAHEAERTECRDPSYRGELLVWTTDDLRREDGVQAASIPYAAPDAAPPDAQLVRRFDLRGMGWLPAAGELADNECLLALCTFDDGPLEWLHTGEALEHIWLELTDAGYWASPIGQPVEVRATREHLRRGLGLPATPQLLLRAGRAPEVPATRRRSSWDVIRAG